MGLETATYISDLNSANPAATDPKSQGDDHIRLVKAALKASFPLVAGPVAIADSDFASKTYVNSVAFSTALPGQTGSAGKFLTTDGTNASWQIVFPSQTGNNGKFLTTDGSVTSWVTITPFTNSDVLAQNQAIALSF